MAAVLLRLAAGVELVFVLLIDVDRAGDAGAGLLYQLLGRAVGHEGVLIQAGRQAGRARQAGSRQEGCGQAGTNRASAPGTSTICLPACLPGCLRTTCPHPRTVGSRHSLRNAPASLPARLALSWAWKARDRQLRPVGGLRAVRWRGRMRTALPALGGLMRPRTWTTDKPRIRGSSASPRQAAHA